MRIAGDGFTLRPWRKGDVADIVRFGNNRAIWRNLTHRFPHPYTRKDAKEWIATSNAYPEDQRNWAIEFDGRAVGAVGFERKTGLHTRTAEIGYWLGEPYWGRGLATAALRIATDVACSPAFDFIRIQAGIMSWNPASCRVAEKCGYTLEARLKKAVFKDEAVCDYLIYVRFPDT